MRPKGECLQYQGSAQIYLYNYMPWSVLVPFKGGILENNFEFVAGWGGGTHKKIPSYFLNKIFCLMHFSALATFSSVTNELATTCIKA